MKTISSTFLAVLGLGLVSPGAGWAQTDAIAPGRSGAIAPSAGLATETAIPSPAARPTLELYTARQRLTGGFGDWRETGVRGNYQVGSHLLQAEAATMRRFNQSGNYFGFGDTITLDADWFTTLSAGAGDGADYLPRYRGDVFVNRKLLPARNLIATLGAGYYRAPDGHVDRNLSVGGIYYFAAPVVVQAEVRFNNSSPGDVDARQQFVAATLGRPLQTQVTVRHAWGVEAYQSIGAGTTLVGFRSKQSSLGVRHWLGPDWGIQLTGERYRNPFYRRDGATVALFWQLP